MFLKRVRLVTGVLVGGSGVFPEALPEQSGKINILGAAGPVAVRA